MRTLLMLFMIGAGISAWSDDNVSNDFSGTNAEIKELRHDELAYRFHVKGEIFILNQSGDKLIDVANETREWQFGGPKDQPMESNWRFRQSGLPTVALRQRWDLLGDGKVSVEIAQFENIERGNGSDIKYGKLIKEEKFILKDFAPINWTIPAGNQKLVVRLTPGVWQNIEAIDISEMPISGKNIVVFDKRGKVWGDQVNPDHPSKYLGIVTPEGSLFLSYVPFPGAQKIGEVRGGRMRITNFKPRIFLQSEMPFLPANVKANVYGIIKREMKSGKPNSIRTYSSSKVEEFLKALSEK